jgi:hypothetical protein
MAVIDETGEYLCDSCRLKVYRDIIFREEQKPYGNVLPVIVAQEWWHNCDSYDGPVELCNYCNQERY